jgi:transcriptional regulator
MYRPAAYVRDDVALLHNVIRERSFATIAAVMNGAVHFAYAPVVLDALSGPRGGVRFHLARANPLAMLDGATIGLSFMGLDSYISPDWYETQGLVPTWNYIAIEGTGVAVRLDEAGLRQLLVDLSSAHEGPLLPKKPWTLDKIPEAKIAALMNAISGFSLVFETLEGKFKLSQDKRPEDAAGVVSHLESLNDATSRATAAAMRKYGHFMGTK